MLEALFELRNRADLAGDGWVSVRAAVWSRTYGEHVLGAHGDLVLTFEVRDGDEVLGVIDVVCRGVREHQLLDANGGGVALIEDPEHPAILAHAEGRRTLAVRPPAGADVDRAVGVVVRAHRDVAGDWVRHDQYLGRAAPLEDVLGSGGALTDVPATFAAAYEEALVELGYEVRAENAEPPKYWDGNEWRPQTEPLRLLHFGDSFVVAEYFEARAAIAA